MWCLEVVFSKVTESDLPLFACVLINRHVENPTVFLQLQVNDHQKRMQVPDVCAEGWLLVLSWGRLSLWLDANKMNWQFTFGSWFAYKKKRCRRSQVGGEGSGRERVGGGEREGERAGERVGESAGERRDDEALEGEEGHLDIWEPPGVEEGDGVDTSGKQFILNCQVVVCMRVCVCVQGDIQAQMLGERRGNGEGGTCTHI